MEGKDNIKELFSQKLGNYEAQVNPELWAKISSQVAAGTTTTAASGLSVFAKVAIGLGVSAAAIATVVVLSTSAEEDNLPEKPTIEVQENRSNTTPTITENVAETSKQESSEVIELKETVVSKQEISTVIPQAQTTTTTSQSQSPSKQTAEPDVMTLSTKEAKTVTSSSTSEPQIVPVITYKEVTQYGTTPKEDIELITEEPVTEKSVPIKRFVNVFTPNGDKENAEFFLESEGLTNFSVVVFNPEGEIVFRSEDPNFRWDGRDLRTNEVVPSGNYMYMVSAYDAEGNPYPIYERLQIITE